MSKEESMIKKIMALFNKAASTHSKEEAESLTAKANELLLKYNIDKAKISAAAAALDQRDPFAGWGFSESIVYKENLAGNRWKHDLAKVLAEHNLTGILFSNPKTDKMRKRAPSFQVYGEIENVEVTVWLYNYLSEYFMICAKEARKLSSDSAAYCRHTFLKDFLLGCIHGLALKLNTEKAASEYVNEIGALIKFNDKALDEYLNKEVPDFITTAPKAIDTHAETAYSEGHKTGRNVKLTGRRLSNAESNVTKKLLGNK